MARHCKFTSTISKWTIAGKKRKNFVMEFQWGTYHYFVEGERLDNLKVKKTLKKIVQVFSTIHELCLQEKFLHEVISHQKISCRIY